MADHRLTVCPDEGSFHRLWQQQGLSLLPPSELAFVGGGLADRPAWVFIAGYQAALRQCFPVFAATARAGASASESSRSSVSNSVGWGSYLVSEQRDATKRPTCLVTEKAAGFMLNGTKSWLASAAHLQWLIVKVQHGELTHQLLVPADRAGVQILGRNSGEFLSEMSVAGASFRDTSVETTEDLATSQQYAHKFVFIESRCLMIALCGHFIAVAQRANLDTERLIQARLIIEGLVTAELDQIESLRGLLAGMNALRDWFDDWLTTETGTQADAQQAQLRTRWAANQRLVDMHRGFLERRLA